MDENTVLRLGGIMSQVDILTELQGNELLSFSGLKCLTKARQQKKCQSDKTLHVGLKEAK